MANCIYYLQKELKHSDFEILVIHGILEEIVLNFFKYIFWYKCIKISKEKNLTYSQRFLSYIKCHKDFNILKFYTLKALLTKNWFYFLFFILWRAKVAPSIRIPRFWH